MSIASRKHFVVTCDATTGDGRSGCIEALDIIEGDWSDWTDTGRIFNRGELQHHLRREGWSVGKRVLCPDHAGRAA